MDVAFDQEPAPLSKPVHAVFTIEQLRPHFDALMAEQLPARRTCAATSVSSTSTGEQANDNAIADMWPYDPGFPNEQRALYQTIRWACEALFVVLRVVAHSAAPATRVVNMVNDMRNEEMTLL